MPVTQLSGDTRISIIKRTTTRGPGKVKDLWVYIADTLNWSTHIEHQIEKANKVFYCLRRNVAFNVNFSVKLGQYKSVIQPVLLYGLNCAYQSRTGQRKSKNFQSRVKKWVCGPHRGDYKERQRDREKDLILKEKPKILAYALHNNTIWTSTYKKTFFFIKKSLTAFMSTLLNPVIILWRKR